MDGSLGPGSANRSDDNLNVGLVRDLVGSRGSGCVPARRKDQLHDRIAVEVVKTATASTVQQMGEVDETASGRAGVDPSDVNADDHDPSLPNNTSSDAGS